MLMLNLTLILDFYHLAPAIALVRLADRYVYTAGHEYQEPGKFHIQNFKNLDLGLIQPKISTTLNR